MDRNLSMGLDGRFKLWSLSARRAWIEIVVSACAPSANGVALRKESVDRNMSVTEYGLKWIVALRKESVDRNGRIMNVSNGLKRSLSARRAWIEMWIPQPAAARPCGRSPQGERG